MDFGVVGFEGLVGSETGGSSGLIASRASSDPVTKQRWYGSGCLKQERSVTTAEDDWRSSKLSKTESMLLPQRNSLVKSNTTLFTSDGQQQMLSFSCPKSTLSLERSSQNANNNLPYFHFNPPPYNKNTGYNSGILNSGSMHGPFTQSQWMELEHQALIYKYITANVPIPTNLLIPIRKALDSAGFSCFSGGLLRPNTLPWGTFHLGFSSNTDPEPGRCRRTDGKKWRCSRDAVADQKYCERHINRGRHRSRKPVEGQSGHSAVNSTAKSMPTVSSSVSASVVGPHGGNGLSNSFSITQHQQQQFKDLQPTTSSNNHSGPNLSRIFPGKENGGERAQDSSGLSRLSSNNDLKSKETPFLISKQQEPYMEASRAEFGLVTSNSFLNPPQKSSSSLSCRNFGSSQDLPDQETVSQHSIRQFMDTWPKNHSDRATVSWPELDVQPDRTQLSISIPLAPTDYMSSTSSPNNEKVTLSPLRLSREFDPVQMGLGVGSILNEPNQRQANWIPISWEGGPLGEVLHNTNNSSAECKNASALNLLTDGWDSSPRLASSPTGVLQKAAFGSLSNSSAGSSPRAENYKSNEGVSLSNDLPASSVAHSSSMPAS